MEKTTDQLLSNFDINTAVNANEIKGKVSKSMTKTKNKINKKEQKKLAKAVSIILHHEKQDIANLFSSNPTKNLFVYHFGNGDEIDQQIIKEHLNAFDPNNKVYIFPGISFGFIQLSNINAGEALFSNRLNKDDGLNKELVYMNFNIILKSNQITLSKSENSDDVDKDVEDSKIRNVNYFFTALDYEAIKVKDINNFPIARFYQSENYLVPGLIIIDEFISKEEEKRYIENCEKDTWANLSNRKVQHFGYEFIYGKNQVNKHNKTGELPEYFSELTHKLQIELNRFYYDKEELRGNFYKHLTDNEVNTEKYGNTFLQNFSKFDQLTINKYSSGDGIPPHVDAHTPFEDVFCSVTLNTGVVMSFFKGDETRHIYLKPRSAAFFSGEARYEWEHFIASRKVDIVEDTLIPRGTRISLTFRKVREGSDCECLIKEKCDNQPNNNNSIQVTSLKIDNISSDVPTDIEKDSVYAVYEQIAPHFSHTRYKPWPKVAEYLASLEKGSIVGDIGCGNGKYLSAVDGLYTIGTDRCYNLINIAKEKNPKSDTFVSDSLKLPFRDNCLDHAISIAVIHHFSNDLMRIRAIKEITRIVKPKGTFLIYVWSLERDDNKFSEQDNFVPWHLQDVYEEKDSKQLKNKNLKKDVVKEKNAVVYHRYYHVFKDKELESLLEKVENIKILRSYYDQENWCCICEKTE